MIDLKKTVTSLKANRFDVEVFKNHQECMSYLNDKIHGKVSVGGSVTLEQVGLLAHLRQRNDIEFIDRYNCDDVDKALKDAFTSDIYFTSANALTQDGMLYNVDGRGNRVAALTYGPSKVYVIVGVNKIVKDMNEAIDRVEKIAAVKNAQRLKRNTPCVSIGCCMHCNSDDTICSNYVITRRSHIKHRIEILIIEEDLGY